MRFRSLSLGTVLVVAASISASAQTTTTVRITGAAPMGDTPVLAFPAVPTGSYSPGTPNFYVSPYAGYINYGTANQTAVSLNCVDFFHEVSLPESWQANVTNLGYAATHTAALANTRYGNLTQYYGSYGNVLTLYKQAAWLTLQYDADAGAAASADKTRAIQSAIWTLFNGYTQAAYNNGVAGFDFNSLHGVAPAYDGFNNNSPVDNDAQEESAWWVTESQNAILAGKLTDSELQYFSVLTDQNSGDLRGASSNQEFIVHVTPEPGTVVLMLTGLIALLVVIRRRRSGATGLEAA